MDIKMARTVPIIASVNNVNKVIGEIRVLDDGGIKGQLSLDIDSFTTLANSADSATITFNVSIP
jgi:hypothetical protein